MDRRTNQVEQILSPISFTRIKTPRIIYHSRYRSNQREFPAIRITLLQHEIRIKELKREKETMEIFLK